MLCNIACIAILLRQLRIVISVAISVGIAAAIALLRQSLRRYDFVAAYVIPRCQLFPPHRMLSLGEPHDLPLGHVWPLTVRIADREVGHSQSTATRLPLSGQLRVARYESRARGLRPRQETRLRTATGGALVSTNLVPGQAPRQYVVHRHPLVSGPNGA